ncbi:hypothetical protein OROMI_012779 [Orobanche minor]
MGLEPIWPKRLVRMQAHTTSLSSLAEIGAAANMDD